MLTALKNYKEVINLIDSENWLVAMQHEMKARVKKMIQMT